MKNTFTHCAPHEVTSSVRGSLKTCQSCHHEWLSVSRTIN